MKTIYTFLLLAMIALAGCASLPGVAFQSAAQPPVKPDKALVYVYRDSKFMGAGRLAKVDDNGQQVGVLGNGNYIYFYVAPGLQTFYVALGVVQPITLTCEAGKTYYLHYSTHDSTFVGNTTFQVVTKETALTAMQDMMGQPYIHGSAE